MNLKKELLSIRENSCITFQADFSNKASIKSAIEALLSTTDELDVLINNASSFYATPIAKMSYEDWDKLIGSNLKGPLFLTRGLAEQLKDNEGSVINITDINIDKGMSGYSIYSAAKGGLKAVTKVLARELAPKVRVNAIAPGAILEPPDKEWSEQELISITNKIPLNRLGDEIDIANAVKFVVDSKYITGQTINVDGGRSLL